MLGSYFSTHFWLLSFLRGVFFVVVLFLSELQTFFELSDHFIPGIANRNTKRSLPLVGIIYKLSIIFIL